MVPGGYALRELPELVGLQALLQLRLPDEDNLQVLGAVGLEVREKTELLQ